MRKLLILASALVFYDVVFFSAIAPLLPEYKEDLGLSDAQAGVLSAAYAAGTLLAALPGGYLASRIGPRSTVLIGLGGLGAATVVFGFADQIAVLDAARFVQGVAGALIWAGALTWLVTTAPPERRGAVIGTALGAAVAGALLGPALGAVAGAVGTGPTFAVVSVLALVLGLIAARFPEVRADSTQPLREVVAAMVSQPVRRAAVFVGAPAVMYGAIGVLVPLRLDDLGASQALIAAGFIVGAGVEAALAPLAGRISDRRGRRRPYVLGATICAFGTAAAGLLATRASVLAALVLIAAGAGFCFAPAMTMISDAALRADVHQGYAAGLSNMAWASGQVVGGVGAGVGATIGGDALPALAVAALMLASVAFALRVLPGSRSAVPAVG